MIENDGARRYREVIGELTTAADELRARDRARAAALARQLVDLDDAMVRAEVRAGLSRLAVEIRWELVLDTLWDEQWMTLRPRPRPDPDADPDQLDALDDAADLAANAVLDAVRRRLPFGLG
jgi:hypothetical protein